MPLLLSGTHHHQCLTLISGWVTYYTSFSSFLREADLTHPPSEIQHTAIIVVDPPSPTPHPTLIIPEDLRGKGSSLDNPLANGLE